MPTGVHASIPRRQQLQHWQRVCLFLDTQPHRAVRFPIPRDTPDAPLISSKLLKRMAAFGLVRHGADCSWRLSRTWVVILQRLDAGLPPEPDPPPAPQPDDQAGDDDRCDPFIADTGVDTVYLSLFGEGLPLALCEACASLKALAQEDGLG